MEKNKVHRYWHHHRPFFILITSNSSISINIGIATTTATTTINKFGAGAIFAPSSAANNIIIFLAAIVNHYPHSH